MDFSIFAIFYFIARSGWKCCLRFADSGETGRWNDDDVSDCRA